MDGVALIGLFATVLTILGAIMTPLFKLNTTLSKLNENFLSMKAEDERQNHRLDNHSDRLDDLENTVTRHDVEIDNLKHQHSIHCERGVNKNG